MVYLGIFQITEVATILGQSFSTVPKSYVLSLTKYGLGFLWATFSQTYLVTLGMD
jgi:hypothetical protein